MEISTDDPPILSISKRETINEEKTEKPTFELKKDKNVKNGTDVESGERATTTTRKRPVIVNENEKLDTKKLLELKKKIAEVQAEPVILTQGV